MINLKANQKIQIVLSGAKTTVDCPFDVSYQDSGPGNAIGGGPPNVFQDGNNGTTNGTTAVDMVVAPAAGGNIVRGVTNVTVSNLDTGAVTIAVKLIDASVSPTATRQLHQGTLQVGETLLYEVNDGWYALDTNYGIKSPAAASSSAGSTADSKAVSAGTQASANLSTAVAQSTTTSSAITSEATGISSASSQAVSAGTQGSTNLSTGTAQSTTTSSAMSIASANQSLGSSVGWSTTLSKTKSSFAF